MASIMRFNITDEIDVTDANASINAESAGPASTIDLGYDVALVLLANGLEGSYTQDQSDIESIVSNLTIKQSEFNRGRMLLVTGAGSATLDATGMSAYGSATGAGLKYGSGAINQIQIESGANFAIEGSNFASEKIGTDLTPLGNQDRTFVDSNSLLKGGDDDLEIGHALKHVVAAAMFKDLGKTAALIDETTLATSLQSKFYIAVEAALEDSANYNDSKVFKQYLGTTRYGGADPDFNGSEDYNLNHTVVNFVVNIQGKVIDNDSSVTIDATVVNGLFGDSTADETRVSNDGRYHIKAWVQWFNDDRY